MEGQKILRLAAALNSVQRMTVLADKHRSTTVMERNGLRPLLARVGTVVRAVATTGDNVNKQNAARSALSRPQPVGPIDSFDRAKVRSPDGHAVHCQYWDARTRRALRD